MLLQLFLQFSFVYDKQYLCNKKKFFNKISETIKKEKYMLFELQQIKKFIHKNFKKIEKANNFF